jgi:hypothetical protein
MEVRIVMCYSVYALSFVRGKLMAQSVSRISKVYLSSGLVMKPYCLFAVRSLTGIARMSL